MKKHTLVLLLLSSLLILSACGPTIPVENTDSAVSTTDTAPNSGSTAASTADTAASSESSSAGSESSDSTDPPSTETTEPTETAVPIDLNDLKKRLFGDDFASQSVDYCISETEEIYLLASPTQYDIYGVPFSSSVYIVNLKDNVVEQVNASRYFESNETTVDCSNLLFMGQSADGKIHMVYTSSNLGDVRRILYPIGIAFDVAYNHETHQFELQAAIEKYLSPLEDDFYIIGYGMGIDGNVMPGGSALSDVVFPLLQTEAAENHITFAFDDTNATDGALYLASADLVYHADENSLTAFIPCSENFDLKSVTCLYRENSFVKQVDIAQVQPNCISVSMVLSENVGYYSISGTGCDNTVTIYFYDNTEEGTGTDKFEHFILNNSQTVKLYAEDLQTDGYVTGPNVSKWPDRQYPQY